MADFHVIVVMGTLSKPNFNSAPPWRRRRNGRTEEPNRLLENRLSEEENSINVFGVQLLSSRTALIC
jgi:hypothetical protein